MAMLTDITKINACLLGGAIGDAFGAPVEGLMRLSDIRSTFGPNGLQEFAPYHSFFNDAERSGVGVITDDTTMTMCTLAGMIDAVQGNDVNASQVASMQWRYYLAWGAKQSFGAGISELPQMPKGPMPDYLEPFLFVCGAGRGTIAALLQGEYGTIEKPLHYRMQIGDRVVESPNNGCGAMMRVAPVAFMADEYDVLELARVNAAMTHGHVDAMNAAAATAIMVKNALTFEDVGKALQHSKNALKDLPDHASVLAAWDMAEQAHQENPGSMDVINDLGFRFKPQNPFTALPVLTQLVYTLHYAATCEPDAQSFKDVMRLAVNHAGDSDSVGAIAGNVLGAAWGMDVLPKDWLDLVMCKDDILQIGYEWQQAAQLAQTGLRFQ